MSREKLNQFYLESKAQQPQTAGEDLIGERNSSILRDPESTKEQLKQVKQTFTRDFYMINADLFTGVRKVLNKEGFSRKTPVDLAVEVLEDEGGVVVFSYQTGKKTDSERKTYHLILKQDIEDSLLILGTSDKLKDYQYSNLG